MLRSWSDAISTASSPNALRFINLLPNYASASQLGAPTYREYVRSFIEDVEPDVLCMDHYPLFDKSPQQYPTLNITTEGYHRNLAVLREESQRAGIPFWNFFNSMPFATHLAASKGMIAWQAFTSLAYGAKGVLYFTYWTPGAGDAQGKAWHRSLKGHHLGLGTFGKGGGLLSPISFGIDGSNELLPSQGYYDAKVVNSLLRNFGTFLLEAISTLVWRPDIEPTPPKNSLVVSVYETDATGNRTTVKPGRYLVGQFADAQRCTGVAVLIVNQRFDAPVWPTVSFASNVNITSLQEVDPESGHVRNVRDDSPWLPGLQMQLQPGFARLLCTPA